MTINVSRELLADLLGNDHDKRIMAERHLLAMLANAPAQPASAKPAGEVREPLMTIAQHTRIVTALQARAVVLPERKPKAISNKFDMFYNYAWNACLDEVARLNGKGGV